MRLPRQNRARSPSRRDVVAGAAALALDSPLQAIAASDEMHAAIREALGDAEIKEGRVVLDIPPIVENGNSVPLAISVESPMTPADHVKTIYVFSPENPLPNVSRFHLGPRCGKAEIKTSIRLATTQSVHVLAVMSDGSRWFGTTPEIEVTTAACFDPT